MHNLRELEAQAKALAPVFSKLLDQAGAAIRKDFKQQLDERDQVIKSLKQDLESKQIDEDSIVQKLLNAIPPPKDGEPGADADMDALKSHLEAMVKALPAPENGKSVTAEELKPLIAAEVGKAVAAIPAPENGKSVSAEDVRPMLAEMLAAAIKSIPEPQPGKDADMEALRLHLDNLFKGFEPPKPASAEEIAAKFERRFSDLVLSWERQARDTFDKAADRMPVPKDGENGRDALPLESFDLSLSEDGRTVTLKLQAGETIIEKSLKIAAVLDRGVYSSEKAAKYERGDGATYGGCYWIAQKDAPEGVPGSSADWRLAVKKGRDGRDLRDSASRHDPAKPVSIRSDL